jgi:hypothetical protein
MSRYSPRLRSTRVAYAGFACAASLAVATWSRAAQADEPGPPLPAKSADVGASSPPVEPGTTARVAIRADYAGAVLELRSFGGFDGWRPACAAPCNRLLAVSGMEARVVAPGMTPSKPFRVDPGSGTALLTVNGGSSARASAGKLSLYVGVPLGFAGMGALGYGSYEDRQPLVVGGGIALGVGAALVLVALPLIVSGSTEVTNAEGSWIADATPAIRF